VIELLTAAALFGDEEMVLGDLLEGDAGEGGEGVLDGDDEDPLVFVDELNVEAGVGDGEGDNAEVSLAVEDGLNGLGALGADDVEGDAGEALAEVIEEAGEDVEGGGVVGADEEASAGGSLEVGDGHVDVVEAGKAVLGEGFEDAAGGGEGDFASAALEEADAGDLLEGGDLCGDRGLGHEELDGSFGEAFLPTDLEECAELIEVHGTPLGGMVWIWFITSIEFARSGGFWGMGETFQSVIGVIGNADDNPIDLWPA
jgi:hypothetical protein